MGDLEKRETSIAGFNLSSEKLKALLEIFPLAQIHPEIFKLIQRERTKDESFVQLLFLGDQLRKSRAIYELLRNRVAGFELAFPIAFKVKDNEKIFEVTWIGHHDPCDLCDVVSFCAETILTEVQEGFSSGLRIEIVVTSQCPSSISGILVRAIAQLIPPAVFNQIFKEFFKLTRIRVPCPMIDKNGEHADNCSLCNGEMEVLFYKIIREDFDAFEWLKLVAGIF